MLGMRTIHPIYDVVRWMWPMWVPPLSFLYVAIHLTTIFVVNLAENTCTCEAVDGVESIVISVHTTHMTNYRNWIQYTCWWLFMYGRHSLQLHAHVPYFFQQIIAKKIKFVHDY